MPRIPWGSDTCNAGIHDKLFGNALAWQSAEVVEAVSSQENQLAYIELHTTDVHMNVSSLVCGSCKLSCYQWHGNMKAYMSHTLIQCVLCEHQRTEVKANVKQVVC